MTRAEQFRKSRAWLKTRTFVVTRSLLEKLKQVPDEQEREWYCYIQNKVLITDDELEGEFAPILRDYWKDKIGSGYRRFIDTLIAWGELEVDEPFWWSKDGSGITKSYGVPMAALEAGTCNVDFERKRVVLPRPKNKPTDAVSDYALRCLKQLTVRKELVCPSPEDPTKDPARRKARIKDHCEHIAGGDFSLGYGKKVRRLYHRVLAMPSEGRCNLQYGLPLFEFDVRACHPLLLLSLFNDGHERQLYGEMLSADIYARIGQDMGVADRDRVKKDFQRVINSGEKRVGWLVEQYPFQFYVYHFPKFAKVLAERTDLATHLQNLEAKLLVQRLGSFCMAKGLFWVPMHDGWLTTASNGDVISSEACRIINEAVGVTPTIVNAPLLHG